eukprot:CAMPEP_0204355414 /NCGR_PEP_ID=MMETSP0469-20131031/34127_1 /ASSEMBLY_ACC=CAM_ASM_000384 /TAXON_ID=2969 /ORGANISM="Oxyrrhis marina" /LENGTH=45 /DNA_ID= /DNA_START= /DNA_END= /DNA_ORIENTATION=
MLVVCSSEGPRQASGGPGALVKLGTECLCRDIAQVGVRWLPRAHL